METPNDNHGDEAEEERLLESNFKLENGTELSSFPFEKNSQSSEIDDAEKNSTIYLFTATWKKWIYFGICLIGYIAFYTVYILLSWKYQETFDWNRVITTSSDMIIALSYFGIPFFIIYIVLKRTDVPFNFLFWMFGAFIIGCGTTHLFGMGFFAKYPATSTVSKFLTGVISYATAVVLLQNLPTALNFPSPAQLQSEIRERRKAEKKLQVQFHKVMTIREITQQIRQFSKARELLQTLVYQLGNALKASRCTIHFDLTDLSKTEAEYYKNGFQPVANFGSLTLHSNPIIKVALGGSTSRVSKISYHEAMSDIQLKEIFQKWSLKTILCVNLSSYQENGILLIQNCERYTWSSEEIEIVEAVISEALACLTQCQILELEQAREIADKANAAKTQFLAMISHEVRTPMNAILGMVNILQSSPLRESERECVQVINDSSNSLLQLLNSVLDYAKIESGKMEIEEKRFNLKTCVRRVALLANNMAAGKLLKIDVEEFSDDVPTYVVSDSLRLHQILVNLLSNAVKFTDEGNITIRVKVIDWIVDNTESTESEDTEPTSVKLQFDVQDSGIGIPENRVSLLFKAFSQVDTSMTRKYGGSGLGLAISKRLCEAMKGDIWVKSKANQGTTFSFTIVAGIGHDKSDSDEDQKVESPQLYGGKSFRILMAEDNLVNQIVAKKLLAQRGFDNIDLVSDGNQAVEAVRIAYNNKRPYEIVLMDLHMPNKDGLGATIEIKQLIPEKYQPYIIALTADIQESIKEKCEQAGMNGFVGKPFKPKELMEALMQASEAIAKHDTPTEVELT